MAIASNIQVVIAVTLALSSCARAPDNSPKNLSLPDITSLVQLIPSDSESIFCVSRTFTPISRDSLTSLSSLQVAAFLTTSLTSRISQRLEISFPPVKCAISIVRNIRRPEAQPVTGVNVGLTGGERCEFLLMPDFTSDDLWTSLKSKCSTLPSDAQTTHWQHLKVEIDSTEVHIISVSRDILLVSDSAAFVKSIKEGAGRDSAHGHSDFSKSTAKLLRSGNSPFSGVRFLCRDKRTLDPLLDPIGQIDSSVIFSAAEISNQNSSELVVSFGTTKSELSPKLLKAFDSPIVSTGSNVQVTFNGESYECAVYRSILSLQNNALDQGMDFVGVCTLLGQGVVP